MKKNLTWAVIAAATTMSVTMSAKTSLRAPAYPLITIDPFISAWSMNDHLTDATVKQWTGTQFPLLGVIKVDGKCYRFLGKEDLEIKPMPGDDSHNGWEARYTTERPADTWFLPEFDDSDWLSGTGAFGSKESERTARTQWKGGRIWTRRVINIEGDPREHTLYFDLSHDDDCVVYLNGAPIIDTGDKARKHVIHELKPEQVAMLKPGRNVIAAYCWDRGGNALLDYQFMVDRDPRHYFDQVAQQTAVDVQATQTHYSFTAGPVDLTVDFTAPLLMNNLDLMSRPVNYITYTATSNDGQAHDVEIYLEANDQWAKNESWQATKTEKYEKNGIRGVRVGTIDQPVLKRRGDGGNIDWGYFYMVAPGKNTQTYYGNGRSLRKQWVDGDSTGAVSGATKMALVRKHDKAKAVTGYFMLAYDDVYSIEYFGEKLRPYWNRKGNTTIDAQLKKAVKEYPELMKACNAFDVQLMTDATEAGGEEYAQLTALAYRQAIAAHKLVQAPNGDLLWLSKECYSNGSIGTVDITYPSSPLFLLYSPELTKGLLNHIFYYSESGKWTKDFPAHDVGTYPQANGQTYNGDMPVEEGGNMLITTAALAKVEGNANYAAKHWNELTRWTQYLVKYGLDPENQLCTDDFAGRSAHNTNLAIKAIIGVASYAYLADVLNKKDVAKEYMDKARWMAGEWKKNAADGDHYRLAFDRPNTWSQKYNLVWDRLLGFNLFDSDIATTEIAYYKKIQHRYGLPLDSRADYTKTDWVLWSATMAQNRADFEALIHPIYEGYNCSPSRVPMSDWVWTSRSDHRAFQHRSVVGAFFIKLLDSKLNGK